MRKSSELYPALANIAGRTAQYQYVKGMLIEHASDEGFFLTEHLASAARDLVIGVITGVYTDGKGRQQHDRTPIEVASKKIRIRSLEYFRAVVERNEHGVSFSKNVKTKDPVAWKLPAREIQPDPRPEDIAEAARRGISTWTSAPSFNPEDRKQSLAGTKTPHEGELSIYDAVYCLYKYGKHCNPAIRSQNLKSKKWRYAEVPPATRKDLKTIPDDHKTEAVMDRAK